MARYSDEVYLKEWRQRQCRISQNAAMSYRMSTVLLDMDDINSEKAKPFVEQLSESLGEFTTGVKESCIEDDHAYKLSYLRNFTHAFYLHHTRRTETYDEFLKFFTFQTWGIGDAILTDALGTDICNAERREAAEMDRYMELTVFHYCNRLINLAHDADFGVAESEEVLAEYKQLHKEYEDQKLFDEIAVIRYQLIQSVAADAHELWFDEARQRVYQVDAYDLMNEYNTKAMQVDMSR